MRKILLGVGVVAILFPLGCSSPRPYPWSWPHNKRRIETVASGFERAAIDFNHLVLQDINELPDNALKAALDFDRIVFDMDERVLEDF